MMNFLFFTFEMPQRETFATHITCIGSPCRTTHAMHHKTTCKINKNPYKIKHQSFKESKPAIFRTFA